MIQLKSTIFTIALLLTPLLIVAQESVATSGGTATNASGSVSYTVGQISYTANSSPSGSVSQGIQNAYAISVVTELPQGKGVSLTCTAYPNPVQSYLTLEVVGTKLPNLSYFLIDGKGATIENNSISEGKTAITMVDLASGTYYVKVVSLINNQTTIIKTFEIIKIK